MAYSEGMPNSRACSARARRPWFRARGHRPVVGDAGLSEGDLDQPGGAEVKGHHQDARRILGVSASTASEAIRKLSPNKAWCPTRNTARSPSPTRAAPPIHMVRRHRLLETFLVRELGYGWTRSTTKPKSSNTPSPTACSPASTRNSGFPERDPHGDLIPHRRLGPHPDACLLSDLDTGQSGRVARISDDDPNMLRFTSAESASR